MKKNIILTIFALIYLPISAQDIENIRIEKNADIINIRYDLINESPQAKFNITIFCSINGNTRFAIQNVKGDVDSSIITGRNKLAIWDIKSELSDYVLGNIQNLEFFIQAEKQKVNVAAEETRKKQFIFGYVGSTVDYFGFKFGMIKNWGGYFSLRKFDSYSLSAGAIKWIPDSYFYVYSGIGIGNWAWLIDGADDSIEYWSKHSAFETNVGIMFMYSRIYLEAGTSIIISNRGTFPDLTFGIGISF